MGEFATRVQTQIRDRLAATRPDYEWASEQYVASTPVDVCGHNGDTVVLVELEWRRADPADNTAKLFRHLSTGALDAERAVVCQVFTGYYDLAGDGVSSKRENAEFVGSVAARTLEWVHYHPLTLALDPPKRGGDPPQAWESAVEDATAAVAARMPED